MKFTLSVHTISSCFILFPVRSINLPYRWNPSVDNLLLAYNFDPSHHIKFEQINNIFLLLNLQRKHGFMRNNRRKYYYLVLYNTANERNITALLIFISLYYFLIFFFIKLCTGQQVGLVKSCNFTKSVARIE